MYGSIRGSMLGSVGGGMSGTQNPSPSIARMTHAKPQRCSNLRTIPVESDVRTQFGGESLNESAIPASLEKTPVPLSPDPSLLAGLLTAEEIKLAVKRDVDGMKLVSLHLNLLALSQLRLAFRHSNAMCVFFLQI